MIIFIISKLLPAMYGVKYDNDTVNGFATASGIELLVVAVFTILFFTLILDAIRDWRRR